MPRPDAQTSPKRSKQTGRETARRATYTTKVSTRVASHQNDHVTITTNPETPRRKFHDRRTALGATELMEAQRKNKAYPFPKQSDTVEPCRWVKSANKAASLDNIKSVRQALGKQAWSQTRSGCFHMCMPHRNLPLNSRGLRQNVLQHHFVLDCDRVELVRNEQDVLRQSNGQSKAITTVSLGEVVKPHSPFYLRSPSRRTVTCLLSTIT